MSPETKSFLEKFAATATWRGTGTPLDMPAFWDFVIAAYRNGDHALAEDDFFEVLNTNAKSTDQEKTIANKKLEVASKFYMFTKYEEGIKLLRRFEEK